MSKKNMTLDNTARVDQSVRAGKVWKSPASSKPTYVVEVTTPDGVSETHIPLQGEFRVLDVWFLKVTGASVVGDRIGVYKGKPSASGAVIWEDTVGAAPNAIVRADQMDRTKVAGVGDLGVDGANTNGLWVTGDNGGGGNSEAVVYVLVQLDQ
jgi:hypothetical protein